MEKIRLSRLIFRYYTRIAIAAFLTIGALLVALYFGTTQYIERWMKETLEQQALEVGGNAARVTAKAISQNFDLVKKSARFFALAQQASGEQGTKLDTLYDYLQQQAPNVADAYYVTRRDAPDRLEPHIKFSTLARLPEGGLKWSSVYASSDGRGLIITCASPVYAGKKILGFVGLDVTVPGLARALADLNLPWDGAACLVDEKGRILASDSKMKEIIGLGNIPLVSGGAEWRAVGSPQNSGALNPDTLNISNVKDAKLRDGLKALLESPKSENSLVEVATSRGAYLFGQAIVPSTGWKIVFAMNEMTLYRTFREFIGQARRMALWASAAIGIFYLGFFLIQWKRARKVANKIALPLERLSLATVDLGVDGGTNDLPDSGVEEIDRLSGNFEKMAASLAEKTQALIEARVSSELKGKEAELAYARGLYQSASANLHDAGNAVTILESSLLDLNKVIRSSEQYPEVFQRLKDGGVAAQGMLDRFETVLVGETTPRLRALAASVTRLKDTIKRSIQEQQAVFRVVKREGEFKKAFTQAREEIDLTALLKEMCGVFSKDYPPLESDIAPGLRVRSHRTHLWAGLDNIIRNAIEASPFLGTIRVSASAVPRGVVVTVADEGSGITAEHSPKVGERGFTTKPKGHGLGLSGFREFLEFFGGSLKIYSEGTGQGTKITVEIRNE